MGELDWELPPWQRLERLSVAVAMVTVVIAMVVAFDGQVAVAGVFVALAGVAVMLAATHGRRVPHRIELMEAGLVLRSRAGSTPVPWA